MFRERVTRAHALDTGLRYSSVATQLRELLVKPLRAVQDQISPCVIVLDALDECKDDNFTSLILSCLSQHISALAPLKFFITSRPDERIRGGFQLARLQLTTQRLDLHEVKLDVIEHDIGHYLMTHFEAMKNQYVVEDGWPALKDVDALTSLSSGLFIFAATAVNFIRDRGYSDPSDQLSRLLTATVIEGSSPYHYLDQLYLQVLHSSFPTEVPRRLREILGTIAVLQQPLHPADIEQLLKLDSGTVRNTVLHLGSVLLVPQGDDEMIRLVHPSFFDFLTNRLRCSDLRFTVDPKTQHAFLAQLCLEAMKGLKRDICKIGDPSKLDCEVPDLIERIARHIPPYLQYACHNWAYHLSHSRVSEAPLVFLREFCLNSLLHWIEVCSLFGELQSALLGLTAALKLVMVCICDLIVVTY